MEPEEYPYTLELVPVRLPLVRHRPDLTAVDRCDGLRAIDVRPNRCVRVVQEHDRISRGRVIAPDVREVRLDAERSEIERTRVDERGSAPSGKTTGIRVSWPIICVPGTKGSGLSTASTSDAGGTYANIPVSKVTPGSSLNSVDSVRSRNAPPAGIGVRSPDRVRADLREIRPSFSGRRERCHLSEEVHEHPPISERCRGTSSPSSSGIGSKRRPLPVAGSTVSVSLS